MLFAVVFFQATLRAVVDGVSVAFLEASLAADGPCRSALPPGYLRKLDTVLATASEQSAPGEGGTGSQGAQGVRGSGGQLASGAPCDTAYCVAYCWCCTPRARHARHDTTRHDTAAPRPNFAKATRAAAGRQPRQRGTPMARRWHGDSAHCPGRERGCRSSHCSHL